MPAANAITNSIAQNAGRQIKYLTKSLVRTALKCPRKLAYATNPQIYPRDDKYINDPLRQYLSREGERFGEYCRSLFPHGVEISGSSSVSLEDIVSQTRHALMEGERQEERITLFEGAIRHGSFYVRPDIIDKISHTSGNTNQTELRLIEVKSKSWDSRDDLADKMSTNKGAIKATYLPYIQDIAFQTMTMREAYPELHISPWLMLPDRAKKMKDIDTSQNVIVGVPSVEDTMRIIDDSIATLINVDELVEKALVSEVQYPGSKKGETLTDVVHYWADQLNNGQNEMDMLSSTPIGMHCGSCEYRPENISEEKYSGFDICWQNASGTEPDGFQKDALVIDLFGIAKKSLEPFISERKYKLTELSASDFELSGRKAANDEGAISTTKRQWLQVQTHKRRYERDKHAPPSYVMNKKCIEQEMKKWDYPLHFIDFETIGPVIPLYPGMSPYEVCAFQFSHHEMNENSNGVCEVKHATQFLHTEEGSPNIAFVKALCEAVGNISTDGGTVTMWSPHENTVLRSLLKSPGVLESLSPQELSALSAILSTGSHPMVDLCKLAKQYYYVDGSEGYSSIKQLLQPTLNASPRLKAIYETPTYNGSNFTDFQWYQMDEITGHAKDPYTILSEQNMEHGSENNVTKGGAAAAAFVELQSNLELDEQARATIEQSLLRYCELDTLAMVMIVQAWQGFLADEA